MNKNTLSTTDRAPQTDIVSAATGGSEQNDEISLIDILIVLAEKKALILTLGVAFALGGIALALLLPKRYSATVTLLPPQQSSMAGASLASQLGSMGGMAALAGSSLGIKNPNDMLVSMFKSRTVEDAMVRHFNLMDEYRARYLSDARKRFESNATIDGSGKDGLIRITFEDRDPKRAAEIANGYVAEFQRFSESLAVTEAAQRRLFFEQQLEKAKNNLADAEEALKKTELQTGVIQLDSQARALIESATSLRAQIAAKEVQIQSLRMFATDQNAQLAQAQQELASMQAQLAKLKDADGTHGAEMLVPSNRVPLVGTEYIRKFRDVKYYETIFDILARQFESAKLDEAKQGAPVQIIDAAVPPEHRSSPKRGRIVVLSGLLGLILGISIALVRASFDNSRNGGRFKEGLMRLRKALSLRRDTHLQEN